MNHSLVSSLRCIKCGNALRLDDVGAGSETATVETGVMVCACGALFPVSGGIARLLPTADKSQLGGAGSKEEAVREFVAQWQRKQRSFGRQWNRYEVQSHAEDIATFEAKTGFARESL